MKVVVIGSGVLGLSIALKILQRFSSEVEIEVIAPTLGSAPFSALFESPGFHVDPVSEAVRLAADTRIEFETEGSLLRKHSNACKVYNFSRTSSKPDLTWQSKNTGFVRDARRHHAFLQAVGTDVKWAYCYDSFVIDCPAYLRDLRRHLENSGVRFVRRELSSIDEIVEERGDSIIVNASGLGSRHLVPDASMYPARGHILKLGPSSFTAAFRSHGLIAVATSDDLTYAIPHPFSDHVELGGSLESHQWERKFSIEKRQEILQKARRTFKSAASRSSNDAASLQIEDHWCGLRPVRDAGIRLEMEQRKANVIHCYGVGGSGFTLSIGLANDVVRMIERKRKESNNKQSKL